MQINVTRISLNIDIDVAVRWLVCSSAVVLLLGYFREAYVALIGIETPLKDLRQIALDTEHCLGSFYSSALMGVASVLMIIIGQRDDLRPTRKRWYFLALVFAVMSLDESVSFHEILITPLRPAFDFSSYLHFAWIVPGALFTLAMGAAYLPFVLKLAPRLRNRIALAGGLYVAGALGMEAIGGHFNSIGGFGNPSYILAFIVEETLEIVGLTLFGVSLLQNIEGLTAVNEKRWHGARPVTQLPAE